MEPDLTAETWEPGPQPQIPEHHTTHNTRTLGERIVHFGMRGLVLGATIGTTILGPLMGSTDPHDTAMHAQKVVVEGDSPTALKDSPAPLDDTRSVAVHALHRRHDQVRSVDKAHTSSTGPQRRYTAKIAMKTTMGAATPAGPTKTEFGIANSTSTNSSKGCYWIMDSPWDFYEGEACAGDMMFVEHKDEQSGDDYGLILVSGIYKCGYMQAGAISSFKARGKLEKACDPYYRPLTHDFDEIIEDPNCKSQPGVCDDGTRIPLTPECNGVEYKNFATKYSSPLNLFPEGRPNGLMQVEGHQSHSVLYRYTTRHASSAGKALTVRSPRLNWGYMEDTCGAPSYELNNVRYKLAKHLVSYSQLAER